MGDHSTITCLNAVVNDAGASGGIHENLRRERSIVISNPGSEPTSPVLSRLSSPTAATSISKMLPLVSNTLQIHVVGGVQIEPVGSNNAGSNAATSAAASPSSKTAMSSPKITNFSSCKEIAPEQFASCVHVLDNNRQGVLAGSNSCHGGIGSLPVGGTQNSFRISSESPSVIDSPKGVDRSIGSSPKSRTQNQSMIAESRIQDHRLFLPIPRGRVKNFAVRELDLAREADLIGRGSPKISVSDSPKSSWSPKAKALLEATRSYATPTDSKRREESPVTVQKTKELIPKEKETLDEELILENLTMNHKPPKSDQPPGSGLRSVEHERQRSEDSDQIRQRSIDSNQKRQGSTDLDQKRQGSRESDRAGSHIDHRLDSHDCKSESLHTSSALKGEGSGSPRYIRDDRDWIKDEDRGNRNWIKTESDDLNNAIKSVVKSGHDNTTNDDLGNSMKSVLSDRSEKSSPLLYGKPPLPSFTKALSPTSISRLDPTSSTSHYRGAIEPIFNRAKRLGPQRGTERTTKRSGERSMLGDRHMSENRMTSDNKSVFSLSSLYLQSEQRSNVGSPLVGLNLSSAEYRQSSFDPAVSVDRREAAPKETRVMSIDNRPVSMAIGRKCVDKRGISVDAVRVLKQQKAQQSPSIGSPKAQRRAASNKPRNAYSPGNVYSPFMTAKQLFDTLIPDREISAIFFGKGHEHVDKFYSRLTNVTELINSRINFERNKQETQKEISRRELREIESKYRKEMSETVEHCQREVFKSKEQVSMTMSQYNDEIRDVRNRCDSEVHEIKYQCDKEMEQIRSSCRKEVDQIRIEYERKLSVCRSKLSDCKADLDSCKEEMHLLKDNLTAQIELLSIDKEVLADQNKMLLNEKSRLSDEKQSLLAQEQFDRRNLECVLESVELQLKEARLGKYSERTPPLKSVERTPKSHSARETAGFAGVNDEVL